MSQRGEQFPILEPAQIPHAEVFSGYLETLATINTNSELAPEADVAFHQIALEGVQKHARDYLQSQPELIAFYKAAGSLALPEAGEKIEQEIRSAEQLIGYIQAGLLDSLTITQLEQRIQIARLKANALSHHSILEAAFGDLLRETPMPTAKKPRAKRAPEAKDPTPTTPENTVDKKILNLINKANISPQLRAFTLAALQDGAKLLTLRSKDPAVSSLSAEQYQELKDSLTAQRELITELCGSKGIAVTWEVTGATRGTTYRLLASTETTVAKKVVTPEAPARKKPVYDLERFSADLFEVTKYVVNSGHEKAHTPKYISERIAEWLDISLEHGSELVDRQVQRGWISSTPGEKGKPHIEIVGYPVEAPVEPKPEVVRTTTQRKPRARKQRGVFTGDDIIAAQGLFDLIASAGSHDKGVGLQRLGNHLGLDEREVRSLVTRLTKVGVCKTTQVIDDSANTTASHKTTLVKFPSRGAWSRFKSNSTDYLSILPTAK